MANWRKWYRVWRFYAGLVVFAATILFLFAAKLDSWLQVPLALVIVACLVDAIVALAQTWKGLW